jgi:phosphopantetheine--protein transferase-like protein
VTSLSAKPSTVSNHSTGLRELDAGEVHLWLCRRDAVADSTTFCRQVLSRYAALSPQDWQFEHFGEGKPRLVDGQAELDFNLSHSAELLVCAVTAGDPVGVDIEFEKPARDVMRLASRFFSEAEVAALEACEASRQRARFYDLWTLKEATVKSRGEALAPLLKNVSFCLDYKADAVAVISSLSNDPVAGLALFEPAPNYRLALCLPSSSGEQPDVRYFRWLGPVDYTEEPLPLLATSLA